MTLLASTPIENVLSPEEMVRFSESYVHFSKALGFPRDLVKLHQKALGRQTTTLLARQRLWVWQRPLWTVFVGNRKGICFEVPLDATSKAALTAWEEYRAAMKPDLIEASARLA